MKVLVQTSYVADLDSEDDLPELVHNVEAASSNGLRESLLDALKEVPFDDFAERFEWYGVTVLPLRSLERLVEDESY